MSGGGTKLHGGATSKKFFPRVIAENVPPRGFTPPESGK